MVTGYMSLPGGWIAGWGGGGGHHFQKSVCVCKSSSVYNYGERESVYISIKKLQKTEREGERKKWTVIFENRRPISKACYLFTYTQTEAHTVNYRQPSVT